MKTTKRIIAMFMAALMFVTGFAMNASALKATPSNPDPKDNSVIITISELEEGYAVSKDDTVIKKGTATVAAADYKINGAFAAERYLVESCGELLAR